MEISDGFLEYSLYCKYIQQYDILTREEEDELVSFYRKGDVSAGQKLIKANLRFVAKHSRKYFNKNINCLDIIQEGNVGLLKAINRFDPEKGVRFLHYATWWIDATIKDYLNKARKPHTGLLGNAKDLYSLDNLVGGEGREDTWLDFYTDNKNPEDAYQHDDFVKNIRLIVNTGIHSLSEREAYIIHERFYKDPPASLKEVGFKLNLSRERIRQLQERALERLRIFILQEIDVSSLFLDPSKNIGHTLMRDATEVDW